MTDAYCEAYYPDSKDSMIQLNRRNYLLYLERGIRARLFRMSASLTVGYLLKPWGTVDRHPSGDSDETVILLPWNFASTNRSNASSRVHTAEGSQVSMGIAELGKSWLAEYSR